jgi:GntR family transcriptional regulator
VDIFGIEIMNKSWPEFIGFRVDRNTPVPLYHQIKEGFRRALREGQITPGQRLPPEQDLCAFLRVSRGTLKQALHELQAEGFLHRERSKGTFVAASQLVRSFYGLADVFGISRVIESQGLIPNAKTLSVMEVEDSTLPRELLGLSRGEKVIAIERLYCANDRPVALSMYYLQSDGGDITLWTELKTGSLYEFMSARCGVSVVQSERKISAASADERLASLLEIRTGSPVLLMTGIDFNVEGNKIGAMSTAFCPGMFSIRVILHPSKPSAFLEINDESLKSNLSDPS